MRRRSSSRRQGKNRLATFAAGDPGVQQPRATLRYEHTAPSALVTRTDLDPDGRRVTTLPGGLTLAFSATADAGFGMLAPVIAPTLTTPGGCRSCATRHG